MSGAVHHDRVPASRPASDAARSGAAVHVRDTGRGIAEQDFPRLFTPFDRLGAENLDVDGSGVGLTITQKLVLAMDGRLEVSSQVGRGSTFTVVLEPAQAAVPEDVLVARPGGVRSDDARSGEARSGEAEASGEAEGSAGRGVPGAVGPGDGVDRGPG